MFVLASRPAAVYNIPGTYKAPPPPKVKSGRMWHFEVGEEKVRGGEGPVDLLRYFQRLLYMTLYSVRLHVDLQLYRVDRLLLHVEAM